MHRKQRNGPAKLDLCKDLSVNYSWFRERTHNIYADVELVETHMGTFCIQADENLGSLHVKYFSRA